MGGDEIRSAAARVECAAEEVRGAADAAAGVATSVSTAWRSAAASCFLERLGEAVGRARRAAAAVESAGEALRVHAACVEAAAAAAATAGRSA